MSQPSPEHHDRPPVDHRRLFLILGSLVAVMLVLSVAAMTSLFGGADNPQGRAEQSTPTPVSTPSAPDSLDLAIAPQGAARCMAPSVQLLQNQDLAFAGTVQSVEGEQVTLSVEQWFLTPADSGPAPSVTLTAPAAELSKVLKSVDFVSGEQYLVSAREGAVSLCGLTAARTSDLEALYSMAYGS